MTKIIILFLAIYGATGAPSGPFASYGLPKVENLYESALIKEQIRLPESLPGTENLREKAIPIRAPLAVYGPPPVIRNEPEIVDSTPELPGVKNLEEKPQLPENLLKKEIPIATPFAAYGLPKVYNEGEDIDSSPVYPIILELPVNEAQPQPENVPLYESGEEILSDAIPPPEKPSGPVIIPPGTKLKFEDDRGQYSHGFSSPDGTQVQESGHLITTNGGWEYVIAKEGSYSYTSPEGIPIKVRYVADHNGFRITGQSFGRR